MSITRRNFVHAASLAVIAGAAYPEAFGQNSLFSSEGTNALEAATQHAFASLVGESFTVQTAKKSVGSVTLLSVKSLSSAPTRSGPGLNKPRLVGRVPKLPVQPSVSFALQFQASGSQLSQGSYIFGHPSLGSFPLFIVPSGLTTAPYTLTAVINQLKTPDKN